jgi:hypothetical protein
MGCGEGGVGGGRIGKTAEGARGNPRRECEYSRCAWSEELYRATKLQGLYKDEMCCKQSDIGMSLRECLNNLT